jgi:hypothetical protein
MSALDENDVLPLTRWDGEPRKPRALTLEDRGGLDETDDSGIDQERSTARTEARHSTHY